MTSPTSTYSLRISPDALDVTSTVRIGSTLPVASAVIIKSPRTTEAVWSVGASSASLVPQAMTKGSNSAAPRDLIRIIPLPPCAHFESP